LLIEEFFGIKVLPKNGNNGQHSGDAGHGARYEFVKRIFGVVYVLFYFFVFGHGNNLTCPAEVGDLADKTAVV